jgi:hypothetical protein
MLLPKTFRGRGWESSIDLAEDSSQELITKEESDLLVDENERPNAKRPQPKGFHPGGTDGCCGYYRYSGGYRGAGV